MNTKPHTDWLVRFAHRLIRYIRKLDWFVAYCIGTAIFAIIAFVLEIILT